jgi:hypothetical protein
MKKIMEMNDRFDNTPLHIACTKVPPLYPPHHLPSSPQPPDPLCLPSHLPRTTCSLAQGHLEVAVALMAAGAQVDNKVPSPLPYNNNVLRMRTSRRLCIWLAAMAASGEQYFKDFRSHLSFSSPSPPPPPSCPPSYLHICRLVREILERDQFSVNDEDFESQTALHLACTNGHMKVSFPLHFVFAFLLYFHIYVFYLYPRLYQL